jgi:hypothetical protein
MTCAVHTDQLAISYCRTCGKALCQACQRDVRGVIYCQDCLAARLEGTVPPAAANVPVPVYLAPGSPSPGLAAGLGFIPGVGAFYNGQFAKGFVHVCIFALLTHLANRADAFGILVAAWIFYMAFDAYSTAKARLLGQPPPDHLGLNSLLAGFGLGTPQAQPAGAPMATVPPSAEAASAVPPLGASSLSESDRIGCGSPSFGGMPLGAIILIALGILLLLDNLGVFSFRWTEQFWPVILIVLGVWLAMRRMGMSQGRS